MEPKSEPPKAPERTEPTPVIDSDTLFRSSRRIRILHDNRLYQLTITRHNKLILTR